MTSKHYRRTGRRSLRRATRAWPSSLKFLFLVRLAKSWRWKMNSDGVLRMLRGGFAVIVENEEILNRLDYWPVPVGSAGEQIRRSLSEPLGRLGDHLTGDMGEIRNDFLANSRGHQGH